MWFELNAKQLLSFLKAGRRMCHRDLKFEFKDDWVLIYQPQQPRYPGTLLDREHKVTVRDFFSHTGEGTKRYYWEKDQYKLFYQEPWGAMKKGFFSPYNYDRKRLQGIKEAITEFLTVKPIDRTSKDVLKELDVELKQRLIKGDF